jgi:dTDP-4-amino-4,6-dideoxygalactose transaminase
MAFEIPLTDTTLGNEEAEAAARVIRSGWLTQGEETASFEGEFATALGAKHAVAVANGTAALHLAYEAAGLKAGDEVVMPALTFVATMNAALYLQAKPVLVDCASEEDLTLSVEDLKRKLTPRTRLIVTMPYGGFCPDMAGVMDVAREHGIPVVEDACHAPLATLDGKCIGTFGLASTWSFYGNKNLTTGEGGMVVTNDGAVAARIRLLRSHGMTAPTYDRFRGDADQYDVLSTGYNYRLDEVRAAIGRVQLRKLPDANARRKEAAGWLREALTPLEAKGLRVPFAHSRGEPVHHLFVVLLPVGTDRAVFRARLKDAGIQTSIHYPPLDRFSHTKDLFQKENLLPVVRRIEDRLVTLPLGPTLTKAQVTQIANAMTELLK